MTAVKVQAPVDVAGQVRALARRVARAERWEDAQKAASALGELERDPAVKTQPRLASLVGTARIHMDRTARFVVSQATGVRLAGEALAAAVEVLEGGS